MTEPPEMPDPLAELSAALDDSVSEVAGNVAVSASPSLTRPPKPELGDYSTNAAMLLAGALSLPPRKVAEELAARLAERLGERATAVEVAGPGFINIFLAERWYRDAAASLLGTERSTSAGDGTDVLLEFVSANPTGPLTVASGRGAAFGDSLARMLEFGGRRVQREYYVNDAGTQIRRFAESIAARMRGQAAPEGGYEGEYVAELAAELAAAGHGPDDLEALGSAGVEAMRKRIEASLERFKVHFDRWFSERSLLEDGAMERAMEDLRASGHAYENDGALWLRTTDFGDDKDRVLVRSDGEPTYFGTDIAYHRDQLERAELVINPLGADHHGYVPRVRASIEGLGLDPERYDAPMIQFMHVVDAGSRAQMSKRKGEFVTLDELVDEIGVDAARFFLVERSHDTTLDLDLELATRQSQDNPVYYVQYAHARIASILRKAGVEEGFAPGAQALDASVDEPAERALIKRLLELPDEVGSAAEQRAPHRLTAYARATAADFHAFYRDCQVVGAPGPGLEQARLALCIAAKRTLATTLELVGVSAPEQM